MLSSSYGGPRTVRADVHVAHYRPSPCRVRCHGCFGDQRCDDGGRATSVSPIRGSEDGLAAAHSRIANGKSNRKVWQSSLQNQTDQTVARLY